MRSRNLDLEGRNLLDLTPVRLSDWSEQGELVVVDRPTPPKVWRAPWQWLSLIVAAKKLRLDRVGSHAWRAMDGRTTVGELALDLERTFGEEVDPAAERLGMLVRTMRQEGLVAYLEVDAQASSANQTHPQ